MTTLRYAPLYSAVLVLQGIAATAQMLSRFDALGTVLALSLGCIGAYAVALYCGYSLSRNSYVPGNAAQLAQLAITGLAAGGWYWLVGPAGIFVVGGLTLLAVRDVFLTTRRALYFDLAILLTLFYEAIGAQRLPWRWPLAIAFLLVLMFLLIADYTDRRLAQLQLVDTRRVGALLPAFRNAAFATTLALLVAAVIYALMPQPQPLNAAVFPDRGALSSIEDLLGLASGVQTGNEQPANAGGSSKGPVNPSSGPASASQSAKYEKKTQSQRPLSQGVGLFHVRADRPLYVRTHVYGLPASDGWHEATAQRIDTPKHGLVRKTARPGGVKQLFKVLVDLKDDRIPAAYRFARVDLPTEGFRVSIDSTLQADRPLAKGTTYRVESAVSYLGDHPSGDAEEPPPPPYLSLPPQVTARVRELAREITAARSVPSERAIALEQYLRTRYKAAPFAPRGGLDPSEQFLFEDRGGGSRQFASAHAVLLRAIGIPSRIVAGYRARRLNPIHENYEIWTTDRHHWVEAYIERGWVTFDPTPWGVLPGRTSPETLFEAAREYVRIAEEPAVDSLLAGDAQPQLLTWYKYAVLLWGWFATYGKLLLLALIALGAAAWRWRSWSLPLRDAVDHFRLRHATGHDPVSLVQRCYAAIERMGVRRDLGRGHAENHVEFLTRLALARPHLATPCAILAKNFSAARYRGAVSATEAQSTWEAARIIADLIDIRSP